MRQRICSSAQGNCRQGEPARRSHSLVCSDSTVSSDWEAARDRAGTERTPALARQRLIRLDPSRRDSLFLKGGNGVRAKMWPGCAFLARARQRNPQRKASHVLGALRRCPWRCAQLRDRLLNNKKTCNNIFADIRLELAADDLRRAVKGHTMLA